MSSGAVISKLWTRWCKRELDRSGPTWVRLIGVEATELRARGRAKAQLSTIIMVCWTVSTIIGQITTNGVLIVVATAACWPIALGLMIGFVRLQMAASRAAGRFLDLPPKSRPIIQNARSFERWMERKSNPPR